MSLDLDWVSKVMGIIGVIGPMAITALPKVRDFLFGKVGANGLRDTPTPWARSSLAGLGGIFGAGLALIGVELFFQPPSVPPSLTLADVKAEIQNHPGPPGPKGDSGQDGKVGATGVSGPSGPKGDTGVEGKLGHVTKENITFISQRFGPKGSASPGFDEGYYTAENSGTGAKVADVSEFPICTISDIKINSMTGTTAVCYLLEIENRWQIYATPLAECKVTCFRVSTNP